MRRKDKRFGTE